MATLKALKTRISSVKSTQKITKAMKMVAAAKLRRAQQAAEAARPYAERMAAVVSSVVSKVVIGPESPKLLAGTGKDESFREVVAIRRGERVYFFKGSYSGADTQSRQAIRKAIDTIVW